MYCSIFFDYLAWMCVCAHNVAKGEHRSVSVKEPPKPTQIDQEKILTETESNWKKTKLNRTGLVKSVIWLTDFIF